MKTIVKIFILLICINSYGQFDKLKGTWISSDQDVLVINDTLNKYNSNMLCNVNEDEGMAFYLLGDTLSFQKKYYTSDTNYEKLFIERYDLIVLKRTKRTLTVNPSSSLAKKFFNNRSKIKFIKQKYNRDKSIIFEKIIFHTTTCEGRCPTINLEIDNNKNVYLDAFFYKEKSIFFKDSVKSGHFLGKLNNTLYKEFITILQTCNLETLTFPERDGVDGSVTTLIIYYNGKRKYFKSMIPPTIANKLIEFLYLINTKAELIRTNEKRILEE